MDTATLSSRRQTLRAARQAAARDFNEGLYDLARDAGDATDAEVSAEQTEYAAALARQPWQASDAWINAGVDIAPRWRELFLREIDRQTARIAREYLATA